MIDLDGTPDQKQTRGQRDPWRFDGGGPGGGGGGRTALSTWAGRDRAAAGADDEHSQRRQARRQQRGFSGIHGHADRRADFAEALRYGAETFHALKGILHKRN